MDWTSFAKEASLVASDEALAMEDDDRDLANRLFATATAMLEEAIEVAIAGQSPRLDSSEISDHGRRLQALARELQTIAEAAAITTVRAAKDPPN